LKRRGKRRTTTTQENLPLTSSAQALRTLALNTSRTCASWLAESGNGFLDGIAMVSVLLPLPPAPAPVVEEEEAMVAGSRGKLLRAPLGELRLAIGSRSGRAFSLLFRSGAGQIFTVVVSDWEAGDGRKGNRGSRICQWALEFVVRYRGAFSKLG
jgi:hypothetical protein